MLHHKTGKKDPARGLDRLFCTHFSRAKKAAWTASKASFFVVDRCAVELLCVCVTD